MMPFNKIYKHLHPVLFIRHFWHYRELIYQLSAREIKGRYKAASLGLIWPFLSALFMLGIYTVVFGVIFNVSWPEAATDSIVETALILFCGLIVFDIFRECLSHAPSLLRNNSNYVKRLLFPVEVLPLSILGNALFHGVISIAILLLATVFILPHIPLTALWLPAAFIPLVLYALGASWFVAAFGVYFPDFQEITALLLRALFFLSPVVYSVQMIPEKVKFFIQLNPLYWIISDVRTVLLWAGHPDWHAFTISVACGLLFMFSGYAFFMLNKPFFADVL